MQIKHLKFVSKSILSVLGACACLASGAQQTAATAEKTSDQDLETVHLGRYHVYPVKDFAGGQLAPDKDFGFLGDLMVMDAPFAANRYTAAMIENQHARTITEVLNNDPSARPTLGYGNFEQMFSIRGFTLYNSDISFSGLYGALPRQIIATEMIDSVEVLKGATALLNGVAPNNSGVGGSINIQPKRATYTLITRLTADYTNDGFFGGHVDVGRRFGKGSQFGIRVNGVYRDGETAIVDEQRRQGLVSIGADYRTKKLRVSLDLAYQDYRIDQGRPVVFVTSYTGTMLPRAPGGGENAAQEWTYFHSESYFGMMNAEVDATDWLTIYAGIGGATDDEHGAYSSPNIYNDDGDATCGLLEVPFKDNNHSLEFGMRGKFKTGPLKHRVNLGYSETHLKSRTAYTMDGYGNSTNMYHATQFAKPAALWSGGNMDSPGVRDRSTTNSIALADVISLPDDRVTIIAGVRYQKIRHTNYNYDGTEASHYSEDSFTPGGGIVFKPWEKVSLYMNYMEGLQQGPVAPATAANAGEVFDPYRSKQYEIGAKLELGAFLGTVGIFQLAQPVGVTDPGTNHYDVDGETRNRGIEITGIGEVCNGVRVIGGMMFMDSKLRGMKDAATNGNRAFGTPKTTLNMGAEWDLPFLKGITLTARGIHTSRQYADAANTITVPSWVRWDAGIRCKTSLAGIPLTIRANIDNLFDKNYWASAGSTYGGYVSVGAPRTFLLSVTVDF